MGKQDTPRPRATIVVPSEVVQSLAMVTESLQSAVVLIGGWAVRCRLLMARSASRPTDDLDILLVAEARPARAALEAINAVQSDPSHPCRLDGLPLLIDVLADELPSGVAPARPGRVDERIEDPDGLNLLVPPFGGLLARSAEPVRLLATDEESETVVLLPLAGTLLAAKTANVALEFRTPEKRASDGEDIVRLTEAFGALALLADLGHATQDERVDLHHHLVHLGAGGIGGQARASGLAHDADRLGRTVDQLTAGLAQSGHTGSPRSDPCAGIPVRGAAYGRSMTHTAPQQTIAGESLRLLERAERHVKIEPDPGGVRMAFDLPPKLVPVFTRAVMRVEADVLREYADACGSAPSAPLPSPEWIHGYAVVQLLRRIAYRTDTPPDRRSDGTTSRG